jgi:HEAT repeat protein
MKEVLEAVKAYDWGKSRAALLALDAEIRKILGHADHLRNLEDALLGILRSDAQPAAKRGVCKRLGLIGSERSAPTLTAMLTDADTSDMARYALERIPSEAVEQALREVLPKTEGRVRVGIINSLGNRRDEQAVPMLSQLVGASDRAAALAAAWALGRIEHEEATRALSKHKNATDGPVRREVLDAYLVCAGRLLQGGRVAEAATIYKELNTEGMPQPIRRAASRGLNRAEHS